MTAVAYAAGDGGARAVMAAMAAKLPGRILERGNTDPQTIASLLAAGKIELLICGTSDGKDGLAFERAAQRAANKSAIPVVQIEDYPGNFHPGPDVRCDYLIADGEFSRTLARERWGSKAPECAGIPTPRYDPLRRGSTNACVQSGSRQVLWAGQPETDDALLTLGRILPSISEHGFSLLFRAHPNDPGYATGAYNAVLNRSDVTDISLENRHAIFEASPCLVLTQFSSLAIELGFYGIPALLLLYPDAGGACLLRKKSYSIPPWCESGASMLIARQGEESRATRTALLDHHARNVVIKTFQKHFVSCGETAPIIVNHLYNLGLINALPDL